MIKKANRILLLFAFIVISSLMFLPFNNISIVNAADGELVASTWLAGNGTPYQSDMTVGYVSGYGKFILGEENVSLSAITNIGFKLTGFYIDETSEYIHMGIEDSAEYEVENFSNAYGYNLLEITKYQNQGGQGIVEKYIITLIDKNLDGYFEEGIFNLPVLAESISVVAVYDFIYYNYDVTNVENLLKMDNSITIGSDKMYYSGSEIIGSEIQYSDAIIKMNDSFYYFGDLYTDGSSYYTYHSDCTDEMNLIKVDYALGGYRLGETVSANFDINVTNDIFTSKNINLTGASLSDDNFTTRKNLTLNNLAQGYTIEQDEYLRTIEFSTTFEMSNAKNYSVALEVNYQDIYIASLSLTGADEQDILDVLTINYAYSVYNDLIYFTTKQTGLRVVALNYITGTVGEQTYNYYKFISLDSESYLQKSYNNITDNFVVEIIYSTVKYDIDFKFMILDNSVLTEVDEEFNVENNISLSRGEDVQIVKTSISNNIGYQFYAFAMDTTSIPSQNNFIYVAMDEFAPTDITVIMIYTYIKYNISIANFDEITLNNSGEIIYPLKSSSITKISGVQRTSYTLYSNDLRIADEIVGLGIKGIDFPTTLTINDLVTIGVSLNNGFNFLGYRFGGSDDYLFDAVNINQYTFTLNADIISLFADENIIIYIYEVYSTYTLTYYIEELDDAYLNQKVFMADIDVDAPNYAIINTVEESGRYSITVENVQLYDKIKLTSKGYEKYNAATLSDYTYMFIRFTENNKTNLSYTHDDLTNTYTHSAIISRDIAIKVVYSMPNATLNISINMPDAYNIEDIIIYESGAPKIMDEDNNIILESGSTVRVVLDGNIAFGYSLFSYVRVADQYTYTVETSTMNYQFVVSGTGVQYLTINFILIEYRVEVKQFGGGFDGEILQFESENHVVATIDEFALEFNIPLEGYYVGIVNFVTGSGTYNAETLAQTNDYQGNNFYYLFTKEEFINLIGTYSTKASDGDYYVLTINIHYIIHTYFVEITYGLNNPKGNDYDDLIAYPKLEMSYNYDSIDYIISASLNGKYATFVDIPYGVAVSIYFASSVQSGLISDGWYDLANRRPEYPFSTSSIIIGKIDRDEFFRLKLSYISYDINLIYDHSRGTPKVEVNSSESLKVSIYDSLYINANANKNNGARFEKFAYYKTIYSEIVYEESDFLLNYNKYYIYSNGYVLNTSSVYDPNIAYYTLQDILVEFDTSSIYRDQLFSIANYKLTQGKLNIYIYYIDQEFKINTISENGGTTHLNYYEIAIDDWASYDVYNSTGSEIITYQDSIEIRIRISESALANDGKLYDLSDGINLSEINMLSDMCSFTRVGRGYFIFTFKIGDIISKISDDGIINIRFKYVIVNKNITLTTNIKDLSFYGDSGALKMTNNTSTYGFGSVISQSKSNSYVTTSLQFMGMSHAIYEFNNSNELYFYISNIIVRNANNEIVPSSRYLRYGIIIEGENKNYNSIEIWIIKSLTITFFEDLTIEFQVQPLLYYNGAVFIDGAYVFSKVYSCELTENIGQGGMIQQILIGKEQKLNVGTKSTDDIQTSDYILKFFKNNDIINIAYYNSKGIDVFPVNVGRYEVKITFNDSGENAWLTGLELSYKIILEITQREITITSGLNGAFSDKTYNASSSFDKNLLLDYIIITDSQGSEFSIALPTSEFVLTVANMNAKITYFNSGIETEISRADESRWYNVTLYNVALSSNEYNNNFKFSKNIFTFENCIRIMKKELTLTGLIISDKVYDGTNEVKINSSSSDIRLSGIVGNDEVALIVERLNLRYLDAEIGENKTIVSSTDDVLVGRDMSNYKISQITFNSTIYPYSISTNIDGYGKITLSNQRGLTDLNKVELIPLNSTLIVTPIYPDTVEYSSLYPYIRQFVSRNNLFAIGYEISIMVNGIRTNVSNELFLTVPYIGRMTNVLWQTGERSGELSYTTQSNGVTIDLKQINLNVNRIILTQQRMLLKWWQILLIILLIIILVTIIVILFIVYRKKKREEYLENEKI